MLRLFLAGAMLLAGCSGSTGPKMAELSELPASIPVRTLWQASVGEAGDAIFVPVVAGGGGFARAAGGAAPRLCAGPHRGTRGGTNGPTLSRRGGCRRAVRGV